MVKMKTSFTIRPVPCLGSRGLTKIWVGREQRDGSISLW